MFRIKYCREIVLKILYQVDVLDMWDGERSERSQLTDDYLKSFRRVNAEEESFVNRMLETVFELQPEMDRQISSHLKGWKLNRLSPVDRNLLRLGMAESRFNNQKAVVIDDVVRMAKKYGDEESFRFINAILDKVIG